MGSPEPARGYDALRAAGIPGEDEKPHRMHGRSQEVHDWMVRAGVIREDEFVRRVVIDIDVTKAVTCYIERYADSRMLEVIPAMGDGRTEIRWTDKPEDGGDAV